MKKTCLSIVIIGLFSSAAAQQDSTGWMEEIVVTANRFPQKQQQTGKVMTVIPRSELEKNSGRNLGELLNQYAGLTIIGANNTPGTNLDVYSRGSGLGNTLILINGIPAFDVASISSAFDLNFLSPQMIERIEILKGGQSTLYGSDAVAGVINIILRKSAAKPFQLNSQLSAGSFGTSRFESAASGTIKHLRYFGQIQSERADGISAAYDSSGKGNFDRDGFRRKQLQFRLEGDLSERLSWYASGMRSAYSADLDANAFRDDKDHSVDNLNHMAGAGMTLRLEKTSIHANWQYNRSERNYLDDSSSIGGWEKFSRSAFTGRGHFAEIYARWKGNDQLSFVTGADFRLQGTDQDFLSISSFGPYSSALSSDSGRINQYSLYASAVYQHVKGLSLESGIRWNSHSLYGNNFTYTINPSIVAGNWKYFVNISTAFKVPTLYQLYDANSGFSGLRPERSLTLETGVQAGFMENRLVARAVTFLRKWKDGIEYSFVDYRYFNNNKGLDRGIELELQYRKGKWNLKTNYTGLYGEVNTVNYVYDAASWSYIPKGDTTYPYLFRRPAHTLQGSVSYQLTPTLLVNAQVRRIGRRFEPRFMETPLPLDAYTLVDLYTEWKWNERIKCHVQLGNLLNARFTDIMGFSTRPINLQAGVQLGF